MAAGVGLLMLWTAGCHTTMGRTATDRTAMGAIPGIEENGRAAGRPAVVRTPQDRIGEAERLLADGRIAEAKNAIEGLAAESPAAWRGQLQFLQARIALAESETERSLFYLDKMLSTGAELSAPLRFSAHLLRADLAYEARDWEEAYRNYLEAANAASSATEVPARVALRLSEIALYQYRDPERARIYLGRGPSGELSGDEQKLLGRLKRRLEWQALGTQLIGLADGNISALKIDGDDLWIGTWNGGVSRYSLASGQKTIFREGRESLVANTVRSIEITASRVWIGTYQGLFAYSKATSRWQEIPAFGGPEPKKVEALRAVAGRLFVGTLGDGLWAQAGTGWIRLSGAGFPGDFVSCLEEARGMLLIGTLNRGLVLMDLEGERFRSFDNLNPGLEARNITMLLEDGSDTLWLGTYGMGLYRWSWADGRLQHFSRRSGHLGDDWVLCGLAAQSGDYFGTLGGGITRYRSAGEQWQVIGLKEGLASRDISAMAYSAPYIFLGTLGGAIAVYTEPEGLE
jgi:ligand-binding sensor domain-containing protein